MSPTQPWWRVDTTLAENLEYLVKPSMRRIKADLAITGRRCRLVAHFGDWRTYRMVGTPYQFTITYCH